MLLHIVLAIPLILGCGLATGRFCSYEWGTPFAWNLTVLRTKHFWFGAAVAILFLWSDYKFGRLFTSQS